MEEDERDLEQTAQKNNTNGLAQKASDKANKKALDNVKKKAGKKAAVKGKLAAAMGPVIFLGYYNYSCNNYYCRYNHVFCYYARNGNGKIKIHW